MHCPGLRRCNQELKRIVLEHEQGSPSLGRSDVGDRHSGDDVLEWPYPRIDFLKGCISEGFGEFTNIEMEGRLSQDHDVNMDGGAWVNLCPQWGLQHDPQSSGLFMGPTSVGLNGPGALPKLKIAPVAGMVLVFPSWLYHCVNPFQGTGERISISFNVSLRFNS